MRLTTKGRYAVIALVDLASGAGNTPVSLASIADRQEISGAYLEQLFLRLRKRGIVKGMRGPGGGYILSRAAEEISIAEVIRAVDEPLISQVSLSDTLPVPGQDEFDVSRQVNALWASLGLHVYNYLDSISLADVCNNTVIMPFAKPGDDRAETLVPCASIEAEAPYGVGISALTKNCEA